MRLFHRFSVGLVVFVLLSFANVASQPQPVARFYNGVLAQAQTPGAGQPQAANADTPDTSRLQAQLQQAQDTLKDWPNLSRYRDANSQVQPPAPGEDRVVFMGDSITDGWGRKYGKFFPGKPYTTAASAARQLPKC